MTGTIADKIEVYQRLGVKLVWSVYILAKYIMVNSQTSPRRIFLEHKDALDGEDVIPGFKLPVKALFE